MTIPKFEPPDGEFVRQSELVSDLHRAEIPGDGSDSEDNEELDVEVVTHPFCIVVSADCDLEADHRAYKNSKVNAHGLALPRVLFVVAVPSDEALAKWSFNTRIWGDIQRNSHPRFQFIQSYTELSTGPTVGAPELVVDFRDHFTIATSSLYTQLSLGARRRYRLAPPFSHHFTQRFFHYLGRIGLPLEHQSEPPISQR